ncbi:MAG: TonB-dependent receptor [Flavipsychrobacter sp.]
MKQLALLLFTSIALGHTSYAQEQDSVEQFQLKEFVFSANKFNEKKDNIAQKITLITNKEISWQMPQTSATMLEQSGNVFVQRSQMGGGSPNLRGFEASRVLLIVDGVRMNNAIYRGGHLQNVITIDNNLLDRVEVLYGPSSTLYGSDALGGVMLFKTRNPKLNDKDGVAISGNVMTRYSSANTEGTGHIDFSIGTRKFAALTSVTYSDFGDLRQGDNRNPFYGDFGLRKTYAEAQNGTDRVVVNSDPNVQKFTGYKQIDLMEKMIYKPKSNLTHALNIQYSTSSNIPRYDRLSEERNGALRYAQWYYGPQERLLLGYQFDGESLTGFFDEVKGGVNYQAIKESRHNRSLNAVKLNHRTEQLNVVGYNLDFRKKMRKNEVTIGTDGQFNNVSSTAYAENIMTGAHTPLDTRYPDGGSKMYYGAVYAQHLYKVIPDKLVTNAGIRLNYVNLRSNFKDTSFFAFPFTTAIQEHLAWSGNLGIIYMPTQKWRFVLNGATGFRSPNVDDLGKVFESAGGISLVVPNPNLKPEYTYNVDLTGVYRNEQLQLEVTGFYTWLRNAIVQDFYTLNGKDSLVYEGQTTAIVANQNKAKAYIYGVSAALTIKLVPHTSLYSTINYTRGRYFGVNNAEVPLDHIPPVFGKTSIIYEQKKFRGEFYALYNGWKRIAEYSPSGEDNQKYATVNGMPAWCTLNLRTGYQVHKNMSVQMALENILDQNYRVFASGISAPGRNFVLTVRANF